MYIVVILIGIVVKTPRNLMGISKYRRGYVW